MKAIVFPVLKIWPVLNIWPLLCVCAVLIVPVSAAAQKSGACSGDAIRAAAAKQVAPRLVGCRYDEVAVPLVRYFSIFPTLTKTPGSQATSTILEQRPSAGEPLAAGGQLALNVSVGRTPPPQQAEPAPVADSAAAVSQSGQPQATPPAETRPADTSVAPVELTEFAATSKVAPEIAPVPDATPETRPKFTFSWPKSLSVAHAVRPARLWVWLAIIAVVIAVALVFRGRRNRSEYEYERVPKVMARLEYGPGRLNANGPLIVGIGDTE